jgi:hypothetical protein
MATRKPPRKAAAPSESEAVLEPTVEAETTASEALPVQEAIEEEPGAIAETAQPNESSAAPIAEAAEGHKPRFHLFLIDAGWKSSSAKVIRDNFHMIREFQNSDPLYVLTREQSIELIRENADLIGKDPILLVHDLHAKGGRGESGYHGFRLCLGLIKDSSKALSAMQEFLRFVHSHRRSADIEKDIRKKLHHAGMQGALEVIREGAGELME